jgi:hypothetical protein
LKLQDTLTIKPLALETAVFTPQSASTGDTVTLKITLNGPAGTGGFEMSLSGSHPSLGLPTTVTIPQGDDSIEIQVPIGAVLAPTRAYATIDSAINSRRAYIYLGP